MAKLKIQISVDPADKCDLSIAARFNKIDRRGRKKFILTVWVIAVSFAAMSAVILEAASLKGLLLWK